MQTNLFYNSEALFIEYIDIIKATPYYLLDIIKNNKKLQEIMDMEPIKYLGDIGKVEWYLTRKNQNIFKELLSVDIPDKEIDNILYKYLSFDSRLVKYASSLNFLGALNVLINQKMVNHIYIYLPYEDNSIEETFFDFRFNFKFLYGDLKECLSTVPKDTTYVFSDIEKVNTLIELDRLQLSSVMIPNEYRYNKDFENKIKIDFTEINKDIIFKYAFFNAFVLSN